MADDKAIPGKRHRLLVWIERVDCKGKVKLTLQDLPDGVTAGEITLEPNAQYGDVPFTVSVGTPHLEKDVRLVAECDDGARGERQVKLTVEGK